MWVKCKSCHKSLNVKKSIGKSVVCGGCFLEIRESIQKLHSVIDPIEDKLLYK